MRATEREREREKKRASATNAEDTVTRFVPAASLSCRCRVVFSFPFLSDDRLTGSDLSPASSPRHEQEEGGGFVRHNWHPSPPVAMHSPITAQKYNVQVDYNFPRQGANSGTGYTQPPPGFGHPGGLAEEPKRQGCISNFGAGGVRHMRRRMAPGQQISGSLQASMKFRDGALAPDGAGVPRVIGHHSILGAKQPETMNQRRFAGERQRTTGFGEGMAPRAPEPTPVPPPRAPDPYATHDRVSAEGHHAGKMTRSVMVGGEAALDPFGREEGFQYSDRHAGRNNASSNLFRNPDSCPPTPPGQRSAEWKWKSGIATSEYSPAVRNPVVHQGGEEEAYDEWGPARRPKRSNVVDVTHDGVGGRGHEGDVLGEPPDPGWAGSGSEFIASQERGGGPKRTFPSQMVNTFDTVGVTPKMMGVPDEVLKEKPPPPQHYAGEYRPREETSMGKKAYPSRMTNTFDTVGVTPKMLGVRDSPEPERPPPPAHFAGQRTERDSVGKKAGYSAFQVNTFDTVGKTMLLLDEDGRPIGGDGRLPPRPRHTITSLTAPLTDQAAGAQMRPRESMGKRAGYADHGVNTFDTVGKTMVLTDEQGRPIGGAGPVGGSRADGRDPQRTRNRSSTPW